MSYKFKAGTAEYDLYRKMDQLISDVTKLADGKGEEKVYLIDEDDRRRIEVRSSLAVQTRIHPHNITANLVSFIPTETIGLRSVFIVRFSKRKRGMTEEWIRVCRLGGDTFLGHINGVGIDEITAEDFADLEATINFLDSIKHWGVVSREP